MELDEDQSCHHSGDDLDGSFSNMLRATKQKASETLRKAVTPGRGQAKRAKFTFTNVDLESCSFLQLELYDHSTVNKYFRGVILESIGSGTEDGIRQLNFAIPERFAEDSKEYASLLKLAGLRREMKLFGANAFSRDRKSALAKAHVEKVKTMKSYDLPISKLRIGALDLGLF